MKMKQYAAMALGALLALSLTACEAAQEESSASVQSVAMLMGVDLTGNNQYGGVVEAKDTVQVAKDDNKTVGECYVEVGDEVQAGDPLFSYDTDALELTVSSAELEVEQLQNSIVSYESQISELEKEKKKASSSDKLSYTLQIQEAELNKAEAEYNLKQKQAELERLKTSMSETEVTAPVSGIVQAVNSEDNNSGMGMMGMGGSGENTGYITLMETGTYRIKGTVSEEGARSLMAGMPVTAYSRTDSSQTWTGVIESVNTSSTEQDDQQYNMYSDASGASSAKYAFYVTMDSSDGLLIGQHVYLKVGEDTSQGEETVIQLPSGYLMMEEDGGDSASVWAEGSSGKLELRSVTLGAYDEMSDLYEITQGLALEDYIAFPDETLKAGMSVVRYDDSSFAAGIGDGMGGEDAMLEEGLVEDGAGLEEGLVEDGTVMAETEVYDETVQASDGAASAESAGVIGGADTAAMEG